MYAPPRYLTESLVKEGMAAFTWPAPFATEDDLPDGIIVEFPACSLYISEGFEGEVELQFLDESTGLERPVTLAEALLALVPEDQRGPGPLTQGLSTTHEAFASLRKVRTGIDDICRILQAHFLPTIQGDFSWTSRISAAG